MSTMRYYFPSIVDDSLINLAITAKDVLSKNNKFVSIYQKNDELLYGQSPRRLLYLMKQNNKSIFSTNSTNESNLSVMKSNHGPSTSMTSNTDLQTRYLPFDDVENKVSPVGSLETSAPVRHQRIVVSSKVKDANAEVNEHPLNPISSTGSPCSSNQESPHSAEIVKMTAGLNMNEKTSKSPTKLDDSYDTTDKNLSQCSEVVKRSTVLTVDKQDTIEETDCGLAFSDHKLNGDETLSNLATNTDTLDPKKKGEVSNYSASINKDYIIPVAVNAEIPETTDVETETSSFIESFKMCSISTTDNKELTNPADIDGMVDSSLKNGEVSIIPPKDDRMNINPNKANIEIASDRRKRKSSSAKKNTILFRSIPRVVLSAGVTNIDIEISCEIEDTGSPTTSGNSLINDKTMITNLVKEDIKGAADDDSITSPKSIECYLSPLEKATSAHPSGNVPESNSPECRDNIFFLGLHSSDISLTSVTATKEQLPEFTYSPTSLKYKVIKFDGLLAYRNRVMKRSYMSLLFFQNNLQFLNSYINHLGFVVEQIGLSDKEYITKELKETLNDTLAVASKINKRLGSWVVDMDLDIDTWHKCFKQIQQLEIQYGPILSEDGKPLIAIEVVQVYEYEMRAIWKTMDNMIMMGDSRRSLFSQTAHDFEMMMMLFVKCLIHVGILLPREKIDS